MAWTTAGEVAMWNTQSPETSSYQQPKLLPVLDLYQTGLIFFLYFCVIGEISLAPASLWQTVSLRPSSLPSSPS